MNGAVEAARVGTRRLERRSARASVVGWVVAASVPVVIIGAGVVDGFAAVAVLVLALAVPAVAIGVRSPGRSVAIVGDAAFTNWAQSMAEARGREVRAIIKPERGAVGPFPRVDEVLVERRLYAVIDDIAPESRKQGRLLFAEPTEAAHAANANPFDPVLSRAARVFKRTLDLLLLLLLVPFVACTVPFVAIAVKLSSRGPVFFRQQRVGADGRLFRLYKFRTMHVDNDDSIHREYVAALMRDEAPQHNGIYKLANDPRVTPIGRFLRRYSLDEIPQLWNVFRGDMSIIGPRPPLLTEAQGYDAVAWDRLRVTPGLTGLWQVSGRCELSFREMVDLDIAYWQDWSPMLDVRILARTPAALATTRGAA